MLLHAGDCLVLGMVVGECGELIKLKRSRKEGGEIGEQVVKEEVESG